MNNGKINIDFNCMKYEGVIEIYLSIMCFNTRIPKDKLDLNELSKLINNLSGHLLVDNSDKGIMLMIDFPMEAIIED